MTAKNRTGRRQCAVHLDRADVVRADDGSFLLPVALESEGQRIHTYMSVSPDDAARLHAQLDRLLSRGWDTLIIGARAGRLGRLAT